MLSVIFKDGSHTAFFRLITLQGKGGLPGLQKPKVSNWNRTGGEVDTHNFLNFTFGFSVLILCKGTFEKSLSTEMLF